jgi:hypothetical protein
VLVVAVLILAGCGGSTTAKPQLVRATAFSFEAPSGWQVKSAAKSASATSDAQLLEVTTFPLLKPYDDALFAKVARELGLRMREVAARLHGKVTHARTVTVAGVKSHSYDVTAGKDVLEYTFVLRGKKEFQLLCRRSTSGSAGACVQLLRTFTPA